MTENSNDGNKAIVLTYDPKAWPLDHETDMKIQEKFYARVCSGVIAHLNDKLGVLQKIKQLDAALAEKMIRGGEPDLPAIAPQTDQDALQRELKLTALKEKVQQMNEVLKETQEREQKIDGKLRIVEAEMAVLRGKADAIAARAQIS
ncbi:hypothetical protein FOL47_007658 [Perkinsus chesapeaki]|uniref:Uncharacterized protein n=1 Tax=Perkinsus chesapeaki TaxID=330153 RepID=A0A7J6MWD3_PERCH|nr:hypothetical protein FOL47_007658 [Perkinsus chesapeaki]